MLFTVHFADKADLILLGVFMMRSDAVSFVDHATLSKHLVITEISNWKAWQSIKGEIK